MNEDSRNEDSRSAQTGRFVSDEFAAAHPDVTVTEHRAVRHRLTPQEERNLLEAFDKVWAQLTPEQIAALDPVTLAQARTIHFLVNLVSHTNHPEDPE